MKVPFVDLKAQYHSIKPEIDRAIYRVIEEAEFIKGKYVRQFEEDFAKACNVKHCVGVGNGTDAIYIVLKMLGIGPGDEVITVANSWISTSETITQTGARAVFVDTEPGYFSIDVTKIEEKITARTKAILPVHLYGQASDIEAVKRICDQHHLFLIEDCSQAHFAAINNIQVGTTGIASTFSFYPGKNLGAYGDAGAIILNDDLLEAKIRAYANHGALIKHRHEMEGINSRLDGLQAAILSAKLPYIHRWNALRLERALYLSEKLKPVMEVITPAIRPGGKHVFHLYVIKAEQRDRLQEFLKEREIETAIHYPTALPLLPAYRYMGHSEKDFPVAAGHQNSILSLPLYPEISIRQLDYVADQIRQFYEINREG